MAKLAGTPRKEPDSKEADPSFPLLVAEYSSLRSEVVTHLTLQTTLTSGALLSLAAFVTIATKDASASILLLCYPILALALSIGWRFHRDRTMQIADYIREVETRFPIIGWGHYHKRNSADFSKLERRLEEGEKRPVWWKYTQLPESCRFPSWIFCGTQFASLAMYLLLSNLTPETFRYSLIVPVVMWITAKKLIKSDVFQKPQTELSNEQGQHGLPSMQADSVAIQMPLA